MRGVALLAGALACSGAPEVAEQPVDTVVAEVVLVMPEPPPAERGRLVVQSAGLIGPMGAWRARAGRCAEPPSLQITVQEPLDGILLLLLTPQDADSVTTYAVMAGDSVPPGPVARVGVQRIVEDRPYSWQAREGHVTVTDWSGSGVTGTFAVTVHETQGFEHAMLAGRFHELPVAPLDSALCRPSGRPPTR